ncbi:MAG: ankyrin repeat domain-containing protein [Ktedonobacteraceae bacterium]
MLRKKFLIATCVALVLLALLVVFGYLLFSYAVRQPSISTKEELHYEVWDALWRQNTQLVESLIQRNPELLKDRKDGETLLHAAAGNGNEELVLFLLQRGMDPDIRDILGGNTPLQICAIQCTWNLSDAQAAHYCAVARLLIRHGANVNARAETGAAVLYFATGSHLSLIKLLIENGADPTVRVTELGKSCTYADCAKDCGNQVGAKYLSKVLQRAVGTGVQRGVRRENEGGTDENQQRDGAR